MSASRFFITMALTIVSGVVAAQDWPNKPVRFVSPYPPGGSVDPLARTFAAKLGDSLKQNFIVENRTGASGIIGTEHVAKSAPDGYTFVFIFDTHAVHQALNPKLSFDPVKDFEPVMIVGYAPMAITTGAQKPYRNFQDVLAAAKSASGVTLGNVGNGSLAHLTTIVLNQASGAKFLPVAYKGGGPLSTDLIGGHVELAMASTAAQAQHVRSGKMRALVLTGDKRSHTMPDVPTLKELGIDVTYAVNRGLLAPKGTPTTILDRVNAETNELLKDPAVAKRLSEMGASPLGGTRQQLAQHLAAETAKWAAVVRDAKIEIQ